MDNNLKVKEISLIGELRSCDLFSKVSTHIFRMENGSIIANENISFIEAELQKFMELFERIEKTIGNSTVIKPGLTKMNFKSR